MRLWIAKVFNPAVAVTSVPISMKVDHVTVATNDVYELYYDTFDVFMNSQTASPVADTSYGCRDRNSGTIFHSGPVNHVGYALLYP